MNTQDTNHLPTLLDGQGNEAHGFSRESLTIHCPSQITGVGIDILHDNGFAALDHLAGDSFAPGISAPLDFFLREPIGILDIAFAGFRIAQYHPAPVEAEQFGHQMQHLSNGKSLIQALAHELGNLTNQQQFLIPQVFLSFRIFPWRALCGHYQISGTVQFQYNNLLTFCKHV